MECTTTGRSSETEWEGRGGGDEGGGVSQQLNE